MSDIRFTGENGTFEMENPEKYSYLYFPIAGENGLKDAVTPRLQGDIKTDQNHFVTEPAGVQTLQESFVGRNFWCVEEGEEPWSAVGCSAKALFGETGIAGAARNSDADGASQETDGEVLSQLRAGYMWHELTRVQGEGHLKSTIRSFVPVSDPNMEIMDVKITNISHREVAFTPIAAVPLYGRSAANLRDHRHVTSLLHRTRTTENSVEVEPVMCFDERGHLPGDSIYFVSGLTGEGKNPEKIYSVLDDFVGEGRSLLWPEAVLDPERKPEPPRDGQEAIGGLVFKKTILEAGESAEYIIGIGIEGKGTETQAGENLSEADRPEKNRLEDFNTSEKVEAAFLETAEYWKEKNNIHYHTADQSFDQFMEWVNFQPQLRRIYGCSFLPYHDYGKGGRGWRDLWQDCLALILMDPTSVGEMLWNNFAGVRVDGSNATIIGEKPGEFIADRNNIVRLWMDHGFWPLQTVMQYIHQTGDLEILSRKQTYFKDAQSGRGRVKDSLWTSAEGVRQLTAVGNIYEGTVLEHLLLENICAFYEVGEHNMLRLRGADWNDALDMAEARGESVAFTAAYRKNFADLTALLLKLQEEGVDHVPVLKELEMLLFADEKIFDDISAKTGLLATYMKTCEHAVSGEVVEIKTEDLIEILERMGRWLEEKIRSQEWIADGEKGWFNSYYDNSGNPVDRAGDQLKSDEGTNSQSNHSAGQDGEDLRMMLTGQVFTMMSKTADEDQSKAMVESVRKHLFDPKFGGYRLNTNFHEVKMDLGRMFGFAYGQKENGAVFSHMSVMYANALYSRGFAAEGYEGMHALYAASMNTKTSRMYPGIPEYFDEKGRGMYPYLTGAASWYVMTVVQEMFGVKGNYGDLVIEPKLMDSQFDEDGTAALEFTFQNRSFYMTVFAASETVPAPMEIYLDDERVKGAITKEMISSLSADEVHKITVRL